MTQQVTAMNVGKDKYGVGMNMSKGKRFSYTEHSQNTDSTLVHRILQVQRTRPGTYAFLPQIQLSQCNIRQDAMDKLSTALCSVRTGLERS